MSDFDTRAKDWDEIPGRVERAGVVAAAIREQVALSPSMSAFEYGCGTGLLSFELQPDLGPITMADSSSGMLEVVRQKIDRVGTTKMQALKLDLSSDPVPVQRFDLVYTLMTLHHIPDSSRVLRGFHTLLKTGGILCIVDLDKEDGSFHSNDPDFNGHNGFDRADLQRELVRLGFSNQHISTCYEIPKNGRVYPLFLAVATKTG